MQLLAAVLLALSPLPPIPAAEDETEAAADTTRWEATGELSFTDVTGNRALTLLATRLELRRVGDSTIELRTRAGVRYGRSDGDVAAEDYQAEVETRFLPMGRISPYLSVTALRDDIKQIDVRLSASAGADLNIVRDSARTLAVGLALLQDYERFDLPLGSTGAASTSLTRLSMRVTGTLPLRSGVSLTHASMLQPVATDLDDYLFTSQTAVRIMLSRRFALQTTYQFNRDTSPVEGVLFRNDRTLTVGILVQTG